MTRLAFLMWPDTFEDWYQPLGVSREEFLSGYERDWSISMARALVSAGVDVDLVHLTLGAAYHGVQEPSGATVHFIPAPIGYRAFRRLVWGHRWWEKTMRLWPLAPALSTLSPRLLHALSALAPDAVLIQDYETLRFDLAAPLLRRAGLRVLGLDTGGSARPSPAPWKRWSRDQADVLLAVHETEAERLRGAGHECVEVWPVPVRTDVFKPGDRDAARAELAIDADERLVFSATRLHGVKNLTLLADACDDIGASLVLTGEGPERGALERRPRPPRLVGWQTSEELVRWYAAADIVALSSNQEGQPTAVLEAFACSRAVVATAVGGVPEVVVPGRTGWLVPPRDRAALASALDDALSDRARADRFGAAGMGLVQQGYSSTAVARAMVGWATDCEVTGPSGRSRRRRGCRRRSGTGGAAT